jgi:hypothetical protein
LCCGQLYPLYWLLTCKAEACLRTPQFVWKTRKRDRIL